MLFHCQQAAEKSMQGFLTAHDRVFRKTTTLMNWPPSAKPFDPTLNEVLNPARDLTVFAWEFNRIDHHERVVDVSNEKLRPIEKTNAA
jgi:hypothetical protein